MRYHGALQRAETPAAKSATLARLISTGEAQEMQKNGWWLLSVRGWVRESLEFPVSNFRFWISGFKWRVR
jgi:hypothetical protein